MEGNAVGMRLDAIQSAHMFGRYDENADELFRGFLKDQQGRGLPIKRDETATAKLDLRSCICSHPRIRHAERKRNSLFEPRCNEFRGGRFHIQWQAGVHYTPVRFHRGLDETPRSGLLMHIRNRQKRA